MSRSIKKISIFNDRKTEGKRWGNRAFRRKSKQITDPELLPIDKSEVSSDYNTCDWKFLQKKGSKLYKKGFRK